MKLTKRQKEILREFVKYSCEECHKNEKEVGTLWVHRIHRGCSNGEYCLRNIKMVCSSCSKKYHYGEY